MSIVKASLDYVTIDPDFRPLPRYGHLSERHPAFAAVEPSIKAAYAPLWSSPDYPSARKVAGDPDAVMPAGGPDRYRDVVTSLVEFPARDGQMIELKTYRSPNVTANAPLLYRMHGGGRLCTYSLILDLTLKLISHVTMPTGWTVGSHEVDGIENVYAAALCNVIVVSVKYRKYVAPGFTHTCFFKQFICVTDYTQSSGRPLSCGPS